MWKFLNNFIYHLWFCLYCLRKLFYFRNFFLLYLSSNLYFYFFLLFLRSPWTKRWTYGWHWRWTIKRWYWRWVKEWLLTYDRNVIVRKFSKFERFLFQLWFMKHRWKLRWKNLYLIFGFSLWFFFRLEILRYKLLISLISRF